MIKYMELSMIPKWKEVVSLDVKILIIEDDHTQNNVLANFLRNESHCYPNLFAITVFSNRRGRVIQIYSPPPSISGNNSFSIMDSLQNKAFRFILL